MVYIGYPAGTPTHNPRTVQIELKLVVIDHDHDKVAASQKTPVKASGGQGTMNVNPWAPDSMRFAYICEN
jgi:TolB protein